MVVLAPRQLMRSGMTGNVPYYGGRFTPAQAYAAAHPAPHHPPPPPPPPPPRAPVRPEAASTGEPDPAAALRYLRDSGVLSADEYDELLVRTHR